MQCRLCGTELPERVAYCPACGALTPYEVSESGISPNDPTVASASSSTPLHKPATDYGSPPYGVPPQNPYEPRNPYEAPPPPHKHRWVLGWMALVLCVVLIGGIIGFRALVASQGNQPEHVPSVTATASQPAHIPSVTVTTTQTPLEIYQQVTSSTPVLDDPLSQNSKVYNWYEGTLLLDGNPIGSCTFKEGAYHVIANPGDFDNCDPAFSLANDFAFQVQMTILTGDAGGVQFHINQVGRYVFVIFQDGSYELYRYASGSKTLTPLRSGSSSVINTGLNQSNLIAVLAQANAIDVYVNMQFVARVVDSTDQTGSLGLCAFSTANLTEVAFSNAKVWTVS